MGTAADAIEPSMRALNSMLTTSHTQMSKIVNY